MSARRSLAMSTMAMGMGLVLGCSAKAPAKPEASAATKGAPTATRPAAPEYEETPMPTVPPATPAPSVTAAPAPTAAPDSGSGSKVIGPVITFFGLARADGKVVEPASVDKAGVPTYNTAAGSGFILVIEAKPGISKQDVARQVFMSSETDPNLRPDLELISNRDLGDGSPAICDRRKPKIGGVPGINPPSFEKTQKVADAMNDLSCRFETFIESDSSCTLDKLGNFSFARPDTTAQFCTIVARSFMFPEGTTELQVRVRDSAGNPGSIKKLRIVRKPAAKK